MRIESAKRRDILEEAKEELKRVDPLVFVSLKYTRTVDVIKSVLERLIAAYEFIVMELLEYIKEQKKVQGPENHVSSIIDGAGGPAPLCG